MYLAVYELRHSVKKDLKIWTRVVAAIIKFKCTYTKVVHDHFKKTYPELSCTYMSFKKIAISKIW